MYCQPYLPSQVSHVLSTISALTGKPCIVSYICPHMWAMCCQLYICPHRWAMYCQLYLPSQVSHVLSAMYLPSQVSHVLSAISALTGEPCTVSYISAPTVEPCTVSYISALTGEPCTVSYISALTGEPCTVSHICPHRWAMNCPLWVFRESISKSLDCTNTMFLSKPAMLGDVISLITASDFSILFSFPPKSVFCGGH